MLQCVAVCCSVLQCVAVWCSVLQCVAVWCITRMNKLPGYQSSLRWREQTYLQSTDPLPSKPTASLCIYESDHTDTHESKVMSHVRINCCAIRTLFEMLAVVIHWMNECDLLHLWHMSLQHIATHCNTLHHTATHCNTLQHTATHCNTLQHTATHCNTLQHTARHCNTLQHTATHCNTGHMSSLYLQHNAVRCHMSQVKSKLLTTMCDMTFDSCIHVRVNYCDTLQSSVEGKERTHATGGRDHTSMNYDTQHFTQVFTGVPVTFKQLLTGVPKESLQIQTNFHSGERESPSLERVDRKIVPTWKWKSKYLKCDLLRDQFTEDGQWDSHFHVGIIFLSTLSSDGDLVALATQTNWLRS